MQSVSAAFRRFLHIASESLEQHIAYSDARIVLFGTFGIVAFPLYGWIWTEIYPQPYESMAFRVLVSLLCIGLATRQYWPESMAKYWERYWWFVALIGLPTFFTYMLFMNHFTPVWGMSILAASIILVQLVDWRNYLILHVIGGLLAYGLYVISTGSWELYTIDQRDGIGAFFAVFVFAGGTGVLFNLTEPGYLRERNQATLDTGNHIAHEMRTSLQGINIHSRELDKALPSLIDGYRLARDDGLLGEEQSRIPDRKLESLQRASSDITDESTHGLDTIALLLANAQPHNVGEAAKAVSVRAVVEEAVDKRARTPKVYSWLEVQLDSDFEVLLPKTALRHLIDNLLNNAIRANFEAKRSTDGRLRIEISSASRTIRITDNGIGIDPVLQPMIFRKYFTTHPSSEGTGLGLHYCKSIMQQAGGHISLQSTPGEGTSFVLSFPDSRDSARAFEATA